MSVTLRVVELLHDTQNDIVWARLCHDSNTVMIYTECYQRIVYDIYTSRSNYDIPVIFSY
jgi:hypothetical protein